MTDNEIIKALKTCNSPHSDYKCVSCPLYDTGGNCKTVLTVVALDLINRQKAEIERLQSMNQAKLDMIHDIRAELETAKSEAIREFAERLKQQTRYVCGYDKDVIYSATKSIENLIKRMMEEQNV